MTPKKHSIAIVDDHPIFAQYLADQLGRYARYELHSISTSLDEALNRFRSAPPELVVIDISLGQDNGLMLLKELRIELPAVRSLVATCHDQRVMAQCAFFLGAAGVIFKSAAADDFLHAIDVICRGGGYLDETTAQEMGFALPLDLGALMTPLLSPREMEVLTLVGAAKGTTDIAEILHISVKTVETHRENLKHKLHLRNANELAQFAIYFDSALRRKAGNVSAAS